MITRYEMLSKKINYMYGSKQDSETRELNTNLTLTVDRYNKTQREALKKKRKKKEDEP